MDKTLTIAFELSIILDMMNNNYRQILKQFLNIFILVAVLIMNFAATSLPLNGISTKEISDALPSYFTPAGYTFSIWGLIYTGLIAFAIYQARPAERGRPFLGRIGYLFLLNGIGNSAWIAAWHYGYYLLSVFLMLSILVTLIAIYLRLNIGIPNRQLGWQDKLFYQTPFSLYFGWITVATIANVSSVINYYGFAGFGLAEPVWAMIMIGVAVLVTGILLLNRRNAVYAGVLVWAFLGIRASAMASGEPSLAVVAIVGAIAVAGLAGLGYWRTRPVAASVAGQVASAATIA